MRTKQTGFSLIELLIVVSVILVIAAIAIPNLLRSRAIFFTDQTNVIRMNANATAANTDPPI